LQLELIQQRTTFRGLAEPIVSKLPVNAASKFPRCAEVKFPSWAGFR